MMPTRGAGLALLLALGLSFGGGAAAAAPAELAIVKPTVACDRLKSVSLVDIGGVGSRVSSATEGAVVIDGRDVRFCTVEGTLAPAVGFRVRLPLDSWTQRSLDMGCGGLCGHVGASVDPGQAHGCALVQAGGFVLASTDMGHSSADPTWSQDPQRRVDFAYRGVHITRLAAARLTQAFYGQAQKFAYFVGCSDGGREGLMAAQRYPQDYAGIVVGAPAFLFQTQNSLLHAWGSRANRDNGLSTGRIVMYPAKAAVLHRAVVAACDAQDGQVDGLLSEPRLCRFDPAAIQCAAGATDTRACLTTAEVTAARKFYAGPRDPVSGRRLLVGTSQYGSELGWAGVFVPSSDAATTRLGSDDFVDGSRRLVFTDATPPTLDEFEFTEAFFSRLRARHPLNDATHPDLGAFKAAGGKLILWHGWADQHISPLGTLAYHETLQKTMGQAGMDAFMRTYLMPGVAHCGGGEGHDRIDLVTAAVTWVEQGRAPDGLIARRLDAAGQVVAARPVFPYPALARLTAGSDPALPASYTKGVPLFTAPVDDWAGSDFFKPYAAAPL